MPHLRLLQLGDADTESSVGNPDGGFNIRCSCGLRSVRALQQYFVQQSSHVSGE